MIVMTPLKATGVTNVGDAYVHTGFQYAYNVVGKTVLDAVKAQVAAYPSYNIVVTGHSLGGSVGSFAALALKEAFPNKPIKLFTYGATSFDARTSRSSLSIFAEGQPRTGNAAFASLVENRIGVNNIFRAVHTYGTYSRNQIPIIWADKNVDNIDGVPTILFKSLGYRHLYVFVLSRSVQHLLTWYWAQCHRILEFPRTWYVNRPLGSISRDADLFSSSQHPRPMSRNAPVGMTRHAVTLYVRYLLSWLK